MQTEKVANFNFTVNMILNMKPNLNFAFNFTAWNAELPTSALLKIIPLSGIYGKVTQ